MMQTFTGKEYLKIDIANNFGLDKEDWNHRIGWFNANESNLDNLLKQAEEPALYFAGVAAWRETQKGKPTTYPISLDATSSGIQILAALTGDRKAAELCNVVDTGHREDAYMGLYERMMEKVGDKGRIDRKDTKNAIMTGFYNSTAVPKQIFGEGRLLDIFYETMSENAPGAWELTETMLAIWDPTKYSNDWIMPDNFNVKIKVMAAVTEKVHFMNQPFDVNYSVNEPMENGRSLGANMTHSIDGMIVRELARRCMYDSKYIQQLTDSINKVDTFGWSNSREKDKMAIMLWKHYKDSGYLSARILDYLDEMNLANVDHLIILNLIKSLPVKPFNVISVHDCFRVLPNYGNDLRKQYNIILSNIAKSDMLSYILSQIIGRKIKVAKHDPNLWKDILDSNYALS